MPGTNDSPVDDDRLATPTTEEVAAPPPHNAVLRLLEPGEELHQSAAIGDAVLAVTSHRIAIVVQDRTAMDIVIDGLRRIQLDIEKSRPATLVLVPEQAEFDPQVLAIQPNEYHEVASALVLIGRRLAGAG